MYLTETKEFILCLNTKSFGVFPKAAEKIKTFSFSGHKKEKLFHSLDKKIITFSFSEHKSFYFFATRKCSIFVLGNPFSFFLCFDSSKLINLCDSKMLPRFTNNLLVNGHLKKTT